MTRVPALPWVLPSLLALCPLAACRPDFGAPLSLLSAPRILAVRGDPAEAAPGAQVSFSALYATLDGPRADQPIAWGLCRTVKPVSENNTVPGACIGDDPATAIGAPAPTVMVAMPDDACRLFGPDLPPQMPGQPDQSPRAADETGGYYQPVRAGVDSAVTFGAERLHCNLAGASLEVAQDYAARYTLNQHPELAEISASLDGAPLALDALPAGRTITLHVAWTAASPERYPVFDIVKLALVDRREALRLSWYTTAGSLQSERTGRAEDDLALDSDNPWTAPSTPGPVQLYVVLRDSRGGVAFDHRTLGVVP